MEREERLQKPDQGKGVPGKGGAALDPVAPATAARRAGPLPSASPSGSGSATFFHEVRQELKKVSWPSREQMVAFTAISLVVTTSVDADRLRPRRRDERSRHRPAAVMTTDQIQPVEEADEPVEAPISPFDLPGDWYVIHSYSGYENKVKVNLETRIRSMHMENRIFEVHIPLEDVVEIKNGKKVTVARKVFPGYILVRMHLDDDSWYAVRNTPGVTGFVGGNNKPTSLSRREVERFLGVQKEEEKIKPRFKPAWEVGRDRSGGIGSVCRLQRRDRSHQPRPVQGHRARQHLRPRHPGRARVRRHSEELGSRRKSEDGSRQGTGIEHG